MKKNKEFKMNEKLAKELEPRRTKCMVYTRVMGYHRPVESFNLGKKGEHKQRVKFTEQCCG
jgi:anaerobic ribonucleoside-triphosphate reductase